MSPVTVPWRGIYVDPDTANMLTAIAKAAGNDIYVKGIPGFGSYRTNAASGGTDTGGGHADLDMAGATAEQCRRLETVARSYGACAYWRSVYRPDGTRYGWQQHVHILRMDCADLSPAARNQITDYLNGYDGLYYGPGIKHADTGSRAYTSRRWLELSAPPLPDLTASPLTTPSQENTMKLITAPGRPWAILFASGALTVMPPGTPTSVYPKIGLPATPATIPAAMFDAFQATSVALGVK